MNNTPKAVAGEVYSEYINFNRITALKTKVKVDDIVINHLLLRVDESVNEFWNVIENKVWPRGRIT